MTYPEPPEFVAQGERVLVVGVATGKSPWQNGIAERWIGNCRRDLLNYVIVLDERRLKRLMTEYIRYYHEDRTHLALGKGTPAGREEV